MNATVERIEIREFPFGMIDPEFLDVNCQRFHVGVAKHQPAQCYCLWGT